MMFGRVFSFPRRSGMQKNGSGGWTCAHAYLLPILQKEVKRLARGQSLRLLDMGCGPGIVASTLVARGHTVYAYDASTTAVEQTRHAVPGITAEVRDIGAPGLATFLGPPVDIALAIEVIEHLYDPALLFQEARNAVRPGGRLLLSTPYHGYMKNLALALCNAWDRHFGVDRRGGHIKFFSVSSLRRLAEREGWRIERIQGVGRLPFFWKSLFCVLRRA